MDWAATDETGQIHEMVLGFFLRGLIEKYVN